MNKLEQLAGAVAIEAPLRRKDGATACAYIPWSLINKIRAELEERGIDWRTPHKLAREIRKERRG